VMELTARVQTVRPYDKPGRKQCAGTVSTRGVHGVHASCLHCIHKGVEDLLTNSGRTLYFNNKVCAKPHLGVAGFAVCSTNSRPETPAMGCDRLSGFASDKQLQGSFHENWSPEVKT